MTVTGTIAIVAKMTPRALEALRAEAAEQGLELEDLLSKAAGDGIERLWKRLLKKFPNPKE